MSESRNAPLDPAFVRELRRVLHHLYDPSRLRRSTLVQMLDLDRQEAPLALQRVINEAIQALKPHSSMSPQSSPWRVYRTLSDRFIDQFSQREVAVGLGLSVRQMKRQESQALHALADYLWAQYDLEATPSSDATPQPAHAARTVPATPSPESELQSLARSSVSELTDLSELFQSLLKLTMPLQQSLAVTVDSAELDGLPRLAVPVTPVRQAFLNVLTAAVRCVPGGRVCVGAEARASEVRISIVAEVGAAANSLPDDQIQNLEIARQLATLSGGTLEVSTNQASRQPFSADLVLPAPELAAILVIDDNRDTLQLFQRYLSGTRYLFTGTRGPQEAVALAAEKMPRAIILDVMLPGVDGWEILGRLREHPGLQDTPVIVCSILSQEQFALSLGAAAFLHKPVTREELLATLEQHVPPSARGSA